MSEITMVGIYNHETGINEVRPETPEEKAIRDKSSKELAEMRKVREEKEKLRLSALAKLEKLGLTIEEINAL